MVKSLRNLTSVPQVLNKKLLGRRQILKGLNANIVLINEAITKLSVFPAAIGYNKIKAEYELLALKMSKDLLERKY